MRTTKLQKAGREWKACCPFHDEKTPSFTVSDEKGFYHCFGCGAHGDVIRWMTDQRGLQFMDAVKELAAEAGMEVPAPDPRAAERAERRAGLHDVTQAAQDWFVAQLQGAKGEKAREYLHSRGFNARTVERFGFGLAPNERQAIKPALSQFDEAMLVEAGLRIEVEDKESYDRFRGRLMLPIQDARGRVIAFGGRILDANASPKAPKYLNSPDTPLFDKGRTLYNLHRAGPASRQTGRMVVVEGYMDVIALAAAGIEDSVAPLGTALTERQIELLWRMVETPILCFDGDAAGQRAALRAVTRALPLLRPARSLAIVRMPPGLDPDDFLRERGREAMDSLLTEPASLLDTLWQFESHAQPLDTPEDKAGLKARLLAHVDTIQDSDIRALYRRDLLDRFSVFAFPRRERGNWRPRGTPAPAKLSPDSVRRLRDARRGSHDQLVAAVVAGLMRFPEEALRHADKLGSFAATDQKSGPLIDSILEAAEMLEPGAQLPISELDGPVAPPDNTRFTFLSEGIDPQDAREQLAEAISLLVERPALKAALAKATARFADDPEGSIAEQARLRERMLEIEQRLGQVATRRAADAASHDSNRPADARIRGEEETD